MEGKRDMAGRRPKPSHLKLIAGNPGKRPLNGAEPKPARVIPSPPEHLSPDARVAWGRFAAILDRSGVLTEADAAALEQVAETYAEIVALRQDIAAHGRFQVVETKAGGEMERMRPAYSALMDADRRLKAWLVEFGQTPAARSKVKAHDGEGAEKEDPSVKYFA
jgi:P27 family predicted phage terminase small subunit